MTKPTPPDSFQALLDFLKRHRGFDFTGYKRASLERRVSKRMAEIGVEGYGDYTDYLEVHPGEFTSLFNTILINVTSFFRDAQTWTYLEQQLLPEMLAARPPDARFRVWCAGCASGEEAYTIAMVLAEIMGEAAFRDRVKIYATDVDEEALAEARAATFDERRIDGVPPELLSRYFERVEGGYQFRSDLRRSLIFGRNDLVQDAPISRIDLLICRNTLMYFNAETQGAILRRLHFSLTDDGAVVFGKSEMLLTQRELYTPIELKRRVFRTVPLRRPAEPVTAFAGFAGPVGGTDATLRDSAFEAASVAQVIIDSSGAVAAANRAARDLFGLSGGDIGRPLQDLQLSYRPVELRSRLEQVRTERRPTRLNNVAWKRADGEAMVLDIEVMPLISGARPVGTAVNYIDVTQSQRLRDELQHSKQELQQAYDELQSTVEELETTNEEMQSTSEELETTNEELQSTNEELETINEELQSANEELETMNDELHVRSVELDEVNVFLETILSSMGVAVAVLEGDLRVRLWNQHAEELWGVRRDEVIGEQFLGLDIGLPVVRLAEIAHQAVAATPERGELVLDAVTRRGRAIRCRVATLPLIAGDTDGVIVIMEEDRGDGHVAVDGG